MKQQSKEILIDKYKKTNWPFMSELELYKELGQKPDLKGLEEEGFIKIHEGINHKIIELIL